MCLTPFEYGLMLVFELAVVLSAKQFGKKLEVCCSNLIFANLYNFELVLVKGKISGF